MIAFPTIAMADDAPNDAGTDDTITVVGQRQQYRGDVPLAEIPQSVQQIDGKMLQDLNITRLDTALDLASGIARQNNFGGLWDAFAVRGFAGDENFPSGFLVNGFNGGRGYGGPRDASNIERIEVLKGPNGAVFGRGEPGGTVNIITKKATLDSTFGSFAASAGSFSTYRVEGDYNLALTDKVAIRLNGAAQDAGSFRDTVDSNKIVASPSVLFEPSSSTSISYEMEFVDQEVPFDRGVVAVDGVLGLIPRSTFLGEPGDGPTKVKVLGHQVQLQQDIAKDWVFLAGFGYRDTSFKGYSSDAELAGSRQTLEETGNYLARQRRYRDYGTTNLVFRGEVSGKLYTGSIAHHVLVGADWDRFKIDLTQLRFRPGAYTAGTPITAANNAIDIFNPVYGQLPVPTALIQDSNETQKSWGVYFQDQIDITDAFKIRGGGRYDHFRQEIVNNISGTTTIITKKRFSPTIGALYQLTDTLSIYASYGTGFRPNSGIDFAGNPFAPETSKSYEAGLRFVSPGDMITATLAAYTMKKNNILTSDPINAGFSIAAGKARSRGIEADVNAKLPGGLNVFATYAYTDAVWTSAALDVSFGLNIQPGDPLINIPKHAANLLVTKEFDLGDAGVVTIGGGVNYTSKRLGETGIDFYLPDYTLVRALASYAPSDGVKLSVDATNLFNVTYYPASYHRYWVSPGQPRAVTFRVDFSF
ncbi:TonB-dependent siderophore receptor [Novosphingobium sp. KN65.2]|uniref:TonB-dependent siderophore receptor n=1 Tax=Novosphingobium sp. KN65.2 TaxID=1478134 RepID=UPI0005E779D5|nr:TonB-dependent receptor [Novosphingobium sp. KN65.2]CDO34507.1 TonB-dependent siderophore receptor [Novosphingobium sp. KN65.2]